MPAGGAPPVAPTAAPAPESGSTADLEARADQPRAYTGPDATPAAPRPQWKDYAPAAPHGWAKFGHVMAALNPATNEIFNADPERRAESAYANATHEYEAPLADQATQADIDQKEGIGARASAMADAVLHPPVKPKQAVWKSVPGMVGPGGKVLQETDQGEMRWAPNIEGVSALKQPSDKPDAIDQQYSEAIAAGDHETAARLLKVKHDMAAAGQAPQRDQRVLMTKTLPNGDQQVIEATPGMVIPANAQKPGEAASANRKDIANHDRDYVKPAEAVEKSYQLMQHAYTEYETAKAAGQELPTGAQSMVALSTHLSTTFGNVKGARITKDMIQEHLGARGITDKALAAVQSFTNGDALSPDQWEAFHDLMSQSRKVTWQQAAKEADRKHIPVDFLPEDLKSVNHEPGKEGDQGAPPKGATMKVPGADGKMHWSDGRKDLGLIAQ